MEENQVSTAAILAGVRRADKSTLRYERRREAEGGRHSSPAVDEVITSTPVLSRLCETSPAGLAWKYHTLSIVSATQVADDGGLDVRDMGGQEDICTVFRSCITHKHPFSILERAHDLSMTSPSPFISALFYTCSLFSLSLPSKSTGTGE